MKIKKYRADTLREALEAVKDEMGPDAVVLRTETFSKGKNPGVEVTAALDENMRAEPRTELGPALEGEKNGTYSRSGRMGPTPKLAPVVQEPGLEEELKKIRKTVEAPLEAMEDLRKEVRELRRRMDGGVAGVADEMPAEFRSVAEHLLDQGVSAVTVRDLVAELILEVDADGRSEKKVREVFARLLALRVPVAGDIRRRENRATIVLFVGPTGVGKSTTIAKIAGRQILKGEKELGILSTDAYRMGAVEQMAAFARTAKIDFESVYSPGDVDGVLEAMKKKTLVLVDSAGRSHAHAEHMAELEAFAKKVGADEVHLVLPANMKEEDMEAVIECFKNLGIQRLDFTKIDETSRLGCILNLPLRHGIPLGFLCDGQQIPDDLSIADGPRVAALLLEKRG